jgi:two-component system response regulator HydG
VQSDDSNRAEPGSSDGTQPIRVLVVDDEDLFRNAVERLLRHGGLSVTAVSDGHTALALLERETFDVMFVDVNMPFMDGPELLERVKAAGCSAEVVMMSASGDVSIAVAAVKGGAFGFLTKPFTSDDAVLIELRKAAQTKRLRDKTEHLQRQLLARPPQNEMLGLSPKIRELSRLVSGVATTSSTILILGESGTGKELVARAIHERSRRAGKSFVTVNCGALPAELVESELFGHARGAFTSAVSARAGLFDAANGGTILLDEIGDLPISAQVKLLRVLQEGEIKPVGSDQAKTVDVRVIAATNVDLKAAIASGKFRQDLYYRLNVIPLVIPPLRERGDDILLLAQHFLQRHARVAGQSLRLGPDATERLLAHSWPGNVRELEHAMEHAVVFTHGDTVTLNALPTEVRGSSEGNVRSDRPSARMRVAQDALGLSRTPAPPESVSSMRSFVTAHKLDTIPYNEARLRVVSEFNEAYVAAAMDSCGGNISEAARRSGVDRSNFRRLMRSTSGGKSDERD